MVDVLYVFVAESARSLSFGRKPFNKRLQRVWESLGFLSQSVMGYGLSRAATTQRYAKHKTPY